MSDQSPLMWCALHRAFFVFYPTKILSVVYCYAYPRVQGVPDRTGWLCRQPSYASPLFPSALWRARPPRSRVGQQYPIVILVALYRGLFGSKIDPKTHVRNQNEVPGPATSFLAGETVGFCLNAPAGPIW
jgi:hypothetical protein